MYEIEHIWNTTMSKTPYTYVIQKACWLGHNDFKSAPPTQVDIDTPILKVVTWQNLYSFSTSKII